MKKKNYKMRSLIISSKSVLEMLKCKMGPSKETLGKHAGCAQKKLILET
jgi:hypothetical protein